MGLQSFSLKRKWILLRLNRFSQTQLFLPEIRITINPNCICGQRSSRPRSQSTETSKISAKAFNSKSVTGLFCPSSSDSAGVLISMPSVCSFASSSFCFIPLARRASVTRCPTMFRSPNSSFLVFTLIAPQINTVYVDRDL